MDKNLVNFSQENYFIENKGQEHQDIHFTFQQGSSTLYLRKDGFSVHQYDKAKYHGLVKQMHDNLEISDTIIQNHLVHSKWIGANTQKVFGKNFGETFLNYVYGNEPKEWGLGAKMCQEVYYDEIYKGIDLRYFVIDADIKYEYIVEPRAKANQIELEYTGQDSIYVNSLGQLVLKTSLQDFIEEAPFVYQKIDNQLIKVSANYVLKGNRVKIEIGKYNKDYELIIDPTLIFSTYSGSNADNWGNTACYDTDGNLYAGSTIFRYKIYSYTTGSPSSFLVTNGAYQTSFRGGDTDMGIIKYNAEGTKAIYATYYGGNGSEVPISMITDQNGDLVIMAVSSSSNLRTEPGVSFQSNHNGGFRLYVEKSISANLISQDHYSFGFGTDIYLAKLNSTGSPLSSTYFGGSSNDGLTSLAIEFQKNYKNLLRGDLVIDSENNIVISSYSRSSTLGKNSFNNAKSNGCDGIVAKFTSDLSQNLWTSYIGGNGDDALFGIAIDDLDQIYTCGVSNSGLIYSGTPGYISDSPLLTNGILAKISADGKNLLGYSILGTDSLDEAYFVELGTDGDVYITGQSDGNYPVSNGVYTNTGGGNFIHALSNDLETSLFSTVIGKNGAQLVPTAFLVDDCDRIYLSGWGNNKAFNYPPRNKGLKGYPITSDAYKNFTDGNDFYLLVLEPFAKNILYGSFFGGTAIEEHLDGGMSRFDPQGIVYQSVCTGCEEYDFLGIPFYSGTQIFPTYTIGTRETYPKRKGDGLCNNAVFKFDLSQSKINIRTKGVCVNQSVLFTNSSPGTKNFTWDFGDGSPLIFTSLAENVTHQYSKTGPYTIKITAQSIVACSKDLQDSISVIVTSVGDAETFYDTICTPSPIQTNFYAGLESLSFHWLNATEDEISDTTLPNPTINVKNTKDFYVQLTDTFGCFKIDTFAVNLPVLNRNVSQIPIQSCGPEYVGNLSFDNQITVSNSQSKPTFEWKLPSGEIRNDRNIDKLFFTKSDTLETYLKASVGDCFLDTTFISSFQKIIYPNIFTPNGDGVNDTYVIDGKTTDNWKFTVYNRWGKDVYKSEDYQNDYDAKDLRVGTYFYLIESPDNQLCKGWVQIVK